MFVEALFKRAPKQKQSKCASSVDWINTLYIQAIYGIFMEYYTALKMNIVEQHATMKTDLNVILNKASSMNLFI